MTEEVYLQVLQIKEEVERESQELDQEQLRLWELLHKLRERREFLRKVKNQVKTTILYCPEDIRQRHSHHSKKQQNHHQNHHHHHHHILLKSSSSCIVKQKTSSGKRRRRKKDG